MPRRDNITNWNVPVTKRLDGQVEKAVEEGYAATKSELVRFVVVSYLRYLRENEKTNHKAKGKGDREIGDVGF